VLQFGLPGADFLFLGEGQMRELLDDAVWVVGIDLRLCFLLDRRPERRPIVDDLEAVLVDRLSVCLFESLFIDRNFITRKLLEMVSTTRTARRGAVRGSRLR
jgi:hypothetical protein